ncbi:hypothetical protein C0992_005989 [Termitomyces sp. T32_za158]|nr:hypothetical protein C0992_005989 [Termitomyces sp. T32_za158]
MQDYHSILYREEEREMSLHSKYPLSFLYSSSSSLCGSAIWSRPNPMVSTRRGLLTRPMKEQAKRRSISQKKGLSMVQVAVMWSLSKEGVTAPIVGTTSLKNLEELIGEFLLLSFLVGPFLIK